MLLTVFYTVVSTAILGVMVLAPTRGHSQALDQTYLAYHNPMLSGTQCDSAALTASLASIGTAEKTVYLTATNRAKVACTWQLTVNQTIPANILLYVPHGVKANIPPGITLTVEGCLRAEDSDWFTGGGQVNQTGECAEAPLPAPSTLSASYAIAGCTHSTSPTPSVTIPTCVAVLKTTEKGAGQLLDLSNQSLSYTGGDGKYWLLVRSDVTTTPAGWTCVPDTNYCYVRQDLLPATPLGTMIIQRSTVASGLITLTRRVMPTNGTNPGHIYLTDPYINMVCNGLTDESAKMQLAINLSSERGGTTLEAPAGTCLMKNVEIKRFEEDPGGIDNNDIRHGCTSIRGQGPGQTTFMAPTTVTPEDHILMSNCAAFGAGQQEQPGFIAAPNPSGTVIEHLHFAGRRTRIPEHHGLILQGTYARLNNVNFHWINGTALWVGKTTKLESGWINNVHVRGSGRYVDDCGCQSGTATRNAPAVLFDKPTDTERNNNIQVFGLQVGYSWYSALNIDCTDGLNISLYFYGAMLHNHEAANASKQGRLDSDNGALVSIRGSCHNVVLDGFNFVSPGSDDVNTNSTTAPAVPALRIDAQGAEGKPGELILSNSFFNSSVSGKGIFIKDSGRFIMNNVNFRNNAWERGQLEVLPGAFGVDDPEIEVYNKLFLCNVATLTADKVSMPYADVNVVSDCNSKTHSYRMPSDSEMIRVETGAWTVLAGITTPFETIIPHGVTCPVVGQLKPAHIALGLTANPGGCAQRWITVCCASNFTLACNAAPGGGTNASGTYAIAIPDGCSTTQAGLYVMDAQNVTGIFTAYTPVYLHEMFYTSFNPGSTGTATDYAKVIINKRKIASIVPVAEVSNQSATYIAWTPVKFTILDYDELLVNPGESIVVTTEKSGTTGVALNKALITINTSPFPAIKP